MDRRNAMKYIYIITFLGILLDQVTKLLVRFYFNLTSCANYLKTMVISGGEIGPFKVIANRGIEIIPNFFYIIDVENTGGAWGIFAGNVIVLSIISIAVIFLLHHFLVNEERYSKVMIIYYSFLFAGIIGNLLDRIINGYVTDFLNFYLWSYDYPVFNIADILIVVGVLLMLLEVVRGEVHVREMRKRKSKD